MSDAKRVRIQVNYRSGHSMQFECDEFTVSQNKINGAYSVEWEGASPHPLLLRLDEVESIWSLP